MPVEAIAKEANQMMIRPILNNRQRRAVEKTATLTNTNPIKRILADQQTPQKEDKKKKNTKKDKERREMNIKEDTGKDWKREE